MNNLPGLAGNGSLYCVWIRTNEGENAPLVSAWVDSKTRAFEAMMEEAMEQRQELNSGSYGNAKEHEAEPIDMS